MAKYKTTQREILNKEVAVIGFGYCSIQYALYGQSPILYTAGIYGWKADFYRLPNGWLLSTGYAPINKYYNQADKEKADKIKKRLLKLNERIAKDSIKYDSDRCRKLFNNVFKDL